MGKDLVMLAPGIIFGGRYKLARPLGEGGMGAVWSATHTTIGREVAIKVLHPNVAAAEPTAVDRFLNEAKICGSIRHPGIVDVVDFGKADDGSPFIVMELLHGEALSTVLDRVKTLRPEEILPILRDIARALALAHDKGVIHRDLKPANLFLHRLPTGDVVAKVLDFGVSKMTENGRSVKMTRADVLVGSPAYMSPEQAAGQVELDTRADIYSLGVILYEALSGEPPFLSQNYNALLIEVATKDVPLITERVQGLPKIVVDLVHDALIKDREQRIPTADDFADRVEDALESMGYKRLCKVSDPALWKGSGDPKVPRAGVVTSSALISDASRQRPQGPQRLGVVMAGLGAVVIAGVIGGVVMLTRGGPTATAAPEAKGSGVAAAGPGPSAVEAPVATAAQTASAQAPLPSASATGTQGPSAPSVNKQPKPPSTGKGNKSGKPNAWQYD